MDRLLEESLMKLLQLQLIELIVKGKGMSCLFLDFSNIISNSLNLTLKGVDGAGWVGN